MPPFLQGAFRLPADEYRFYRHRRDVGTATRTATRTALEDALGPSFDFTDESYNDISRARSARVSYQDPYASAGWKLPHSPQTPDGRHDMHETYCNPFFKTSSSIHTAHKSDIPRYVLEEKQGMHCLPSQRNDSVHSINLTMPESLKDHSYQSPRSNGPTGSYGFVNKYERCTSSRSSHTIGTHPYHRWKHNQHSSFYSPYSHPHISNEPQDANLSAYSPISHDKRSSYESTASTTPFLTNRSPMCPQRIRPELKSRFSWDSTFDSNCNSDRSSHCCMPLSRKPNSSSSTKRSWLERWHSWQNKRSQRN